MNTGGIANFQKWNANQNPSCFLVDFCLEEINAISELFKCQCTVLCTFYIPITFFSLSKQDKPYLKNLISRIFSPIYNSNKVKHDKKNSNALRVITKQQMIYATVCYGTLEI